MSLDPLVPGSLYDLTYLLQSGNNRWYQWQMTAVYLYRRQNTDELDFSLRPLMGSTKLHLDSITDVRLVLRDAGARSVQPWQINLPKRLVGAVPGPSEFTRRELTFKDSW